MGKEIIAMIPARIGSTRLPKKNLALLSGRPLIYYALAAAKDSGIFDRIILNSDSPIFNKIAERYNVEFYHRPDHLGSSEAKSDNVIYDFMKKHPGDILVWVNPTSPLQTGYEIKEIVDYFVTEKFDSLITVKNENVHCLVEGKPLNFDPNELFARTQDIKPIQPFVYSLMMWKYDKFLKTFEDRGYALLCGKVGYYPVSRLSSIIIKKEDDLRFAEYVLKGMEAVDDYKLKYDPVVERINKEK
jgi:CMP-N-acetylneuraminic acid synthetase